jgi:hypothetical protein
LKRFLFPIESPRKNQSWIGGEDPLKGSLEVTDLFKGAFLLCMGARLDRVQVRNNGRAIATFLITGPDLDQLDSDYRRKGVRSALDSFRLEILYEPGGEACPKCNHGKVNPSTQSPRLFEGIASFSTLAKDTN